MILWEWVDTLQELLTEQAQHRAASIADFVVAVVASESGHTVLHYDGDFDTIAKCTGQPTRWVVPAGAV